MSQRTVIGGALLLTAGCGFLVAGSLNLTLRPEAMATKIGDTCRRTPNGVADGDHLCYGVLENADRERFGTVIAARGGDVLPAAGSTERYPYGDHRVRSTQENRRFVNSAIGIAAGVVYVLMGLGALYMGMRGR